MTRIFTLLLLCAVPAGAFAATATTSKPPMTEDDKVIFAVGEILSGSVKPFAFSEHEMQLVQQGFDAGMHGKKTGIDADSYRPKIQTLLTRPGHEGRRHGQGRQARPTGTRRPPPRARPPPPAASS